ncbi:pilus assembly protein CpaB [Loktanella fryxellensis]|uniref:Pilus assembly protein CpaB n=1 Tax=Loktanella fryxellensis TaxID=245187 RepID=A0A1H8G162_9RHOB|nr:Flp pilus assembly protein CpaB [Loktanella fryxellensis]SEN37068.1 pilus assembly protein CpaB [Loktanella fryxellensis]
MRSVFSLVLVLGMALAGFAVYMVKGYVADTEQALIAERERAASSVATTDVLAVSKPVLFGDAITPEDVVTVKYATDFLPEGTFPTLADLFPEGEAQTRSILRPMDVNEVILASKVTAPGEITSITQELRQGMRAFTIRVDASTAVSGFLRPGNRVDIYWTGAFGDAPEETWLIGSAIELIAVDQSTDRNSVDQVVPSTVTVQVSPDDVARLAQAQADGRLTLSLVGADADLTIVPDGAQAITLPEAPEAPVIVADAPAPAPEAVPETCYTTVRRGTETARMEIACTN